MTSLLLFTTVASPAYKAYRLWLPDNKTTVEINNFVRYIFYVVS
jgi:hypothetical protein